MPASAPITHAVMMPVGSINLFVGFTGATDAIEPPVRGDLPASPVIRSASLPTHEGELAANDETLADDADSATIASDAGSTIAASQADSIIRVENVEDYGGSLEDLLGYESDPDSGE